MNRTKEVTRLAPVAPPCFASRDQWVEYVVVAAADQRPGRAPGPLLIVAGEPVRFNPKFSFCEECDDRHEGAMKAQGRCKPKYLLDLAAAAQVIA